MSAHRLGLLFLLLCMQVAVAYGSDQVSGAKPTEYPNWFKESFLDIKEDVQEAAQANKHVILFMQLNGCPYCYKMSEENFKEAPYRDFIRKYFDVITINIRGDREVTLNENTKMTEKDLAKQMKVFFTPTLIFLDADNQQVARVNGYRSVPEFKLVLDYVKEKAYQQTSLEDYLDTHKPTKRYAFREHPQLLKSTNLKKLGAKPLAVLFEDSGCYDCNKLHDGHLADPEVRKVLKNFNFVRLDAMSETPITDVTGNKTTPKAWVRQLGIDYRPGIVLFDQGKEIARIESMLYRFHFTELLRYVGERHYKQYPDRYYDYLADRTRAITKSGRDIDISK